MTEFKGDKRSKEYREWKKKHAKASEGFGDTVEKFTKFVGLKKAVDTVFEKLEKDCGCEERKKLLNEIFRYEKPECFEEAEFNLIHEAVQEKKNRFTGKEQIEFIKIFERIFRTKVQGCSSCAFKNSVWSKLVQVYNQYQ